MDNSKNKITLETATFQDDERALLIEEMLSLSSEMVEILREHRGMWAADKICEMLLPYTNADAVSITDTERVLAYKGYLQENYPHKCKIRTSSTKEVLRDGWPRTLLTKEEIGFPESGGQINAAIVEPIMVSKEAVGILKFYYRDPNKVRESQISTAHGFARLIATQIAASEVEYQRELSARTELKMLQSQINPHFLFNTISTISAFTRTDTEKARTMLRQFASFYRSTLEQDSDFVTIEQELENVERYVALQQARFGEDCLIFHITADRDATSGYFIPPFCIQPVVENAIRHGMTSDRPLHIDVEVSASEHYVTVIVSDDGRGMDEVVLKSLFEKRSRSSTGPSYITMLEKTEGKSRGLGLAMNNVYERLKLAFGVSAGITADSKKGAGTTITFKLPLGN